jgi:outer membrane protein assembly factor BamB
MTACLVRLTLILPFLATGCSKLASPLGTASAQEPSRSSAPLFGGTPARNMVNLIDKNIPIEWNVEEGKEKNVKWQANLGKITYGCPVIAGGRVFIGTNNGHPRDPKIKGNKSIVMCFSEADGKFLWQAVHDAPEGEVFNMVKTLGMFSTPVVDGDRLYYVLPQCIVICADVNTGKTIWQYDMHAELKVTPFHCSTCSPLMAGNHLFLITGNGVDEEGKIENPDAPSFIALTKEGKLAWKSNLPGKDIIEGQWSNPAYGLVQGKPQVIFPGGDAVIYSFEPETGKLIWKFNCQPKTGKKVEGTRNYFVSTPVIHDNKVFIGMGLRPEHENASRYAYFLCIDATKTGDVSPASFNAKDPQNPESALVWAYGGPIEPRPKQGRAVVFSRTISTCAIHDGLVYIPEETGYMNCLDVKTGQSQWVYDFKTSIWGSPYYVDGRIYIGTEDAEIVIFQAGRKLKVIGKVDVGEGVYGTPVVVNGVMFIATKGTKLFAIAEKK